MATGQVVEIQNIHTYSFEWTIDRNNFTHYSKIYSPEFMTNCSNKWYIEMQFGQRPDPYLWREDEVTKRNRDQTVEMQLHLVKSNLPVVDVVANISIISKYNRIENYKSSLQLQMKTGNIMNIHFIDWDHLNSGSITLFHGNKLKVLCKLIELPPLMKPTAPRQHSNEISQSQLMFESETLSDVKLIVDENRPFNVHKAILAAKSPVFLAMFENQMREKEENVVRVTDIDYDVMKEVLYYIYTGSTKADNFRELAGDVLAVANKYSLDGLKHICSEVLSDNLKVDNAFDTLILADTHNANRLKEITLYFLSTVDMKTASQTPAYKLIIDSHQHLLRDILEIALNK